MWDQYLYATSVTNALELLCAHSGSARLIAGGTDLMLQSQRGTCPSTVMVDVTRIPGLGLIEEKDGWIIIGPQVTFAQAVASPLLRRMAPVLGMACSHVGGPQIRNSGTLVGNVVNAQPAADGAVALFAMDAELEVADLEGRYWMPISGAYRGVGDCSIDACCRMVTGIRFRPLSNSCGSGFQRLAPRKALTLPSLVVAVAVEADGSRIQSARIAVGPIAPTPFRAAEAESYLVGKQPTMDGAAEAGELAARRANPRNSPIRGSREYRTAMVPVLVKRALMQAFATCTEGG
jgi:CO/xanthine dehydrogenase FAD-binding subunit